FEGDIILGTVRDLVGGLEAIAIRGDAFRWPSATVFYRIAESLPHPERVEQAIKHWQDHTPIRFKERTATDKDFVTFQPGAGCSSPGGGPGGDRSITRGSASPAGNAIHEIGHTVGLWHEQSRSDRDQFITIDLKNIIAAAIHNFDQQLTDGDDIGAYDYESIMHYPANAFARDPNRPTITPKEAGAHIGQRERLSAGGRAARKGPDPAGGGRRPRKPP